MSKIIHTVIILLFFSMGLNSCSTGIEDPPVDDPDEKETYFQPGEYGGEPLPGTEHLLWISPSPDGEKVALIRRRTPGELDPLNQLWIMNKDGKNPQMIAYNVGSVFWHPEKDMIAFNFNPHATAYFYVFTHNIYYDDLNLWNSKEELYFNKYTSSTSGFIEDGNGLLISVNGKAYQQNYERGLYTLNVKDSTSIGPLKTFFVSNNIGNNQTWSVGLQYTEDELSSNRALFDMKNNEFYWLTNYATNSDSLRRFTGYPTINPKGLDIILPKFVDNTWQLFHINRYGETIRQLAEMGGQEAQWSLNHDYFIFNRDTHKASGARYIPFKYNFTTGVEEPLWPSLSDSVPDFPDVSTQDPIHLIDHVP